MDLATLAQDLDAEELRRRAEGGNNPEQDPDYRRFLAQASANMDDTGFFSVQVIAKAIEVWGLEIVSLLSSDPRAVSAKANPVSQTAFICNYREVCTTVGNE